MTRMFAAIGAVAIMWLSLVTVLPAHAAEDVVKNLDVSFDIQADGSIKVRYELDWQFAENGRHGIDFGIATREPWDLDYEQDVVYEVTDISVDSPSGAPDQFTQRTTDGGRELATSLRIGDPDVEIDGRDATYVITYTLSGALRTFNGEPELHQDVTSYDYPRIENYTVQVTAPSGSVRGRCLAGEAECGVTTNGSSVTMTGKDLPHRQILTVVAGMDAGVVRNAEPILVEKRLSEPLLLGADARVDVGRDGVVHVEESLSYRFPEDRDPRVELRLMTRFDRSPEQDQLFEIQSLAVTDGDGRPLTPARSGRREGQSFQYEEVIVTPAVSGDRGTIHVAYDVVGAAWTEDGRAHVLWQLLSQSESLDATDLRWTFPADVTTASCVSRGSSGSQLSCNQKLPVSGSTITIDELSETDFLLLLSAELPVDAFAQSPPRLADSLDLARRNTMIASLALAVGAFLVIGAGVIWLATRPLARDRRHAGVAPGLTGTGAVTDADPNQLVPVQFHVPDVDFPAAGMILDGRFKPRHTAAVLTHMAVEGLVVLKSKPLSVARTEGAASEERVRKAILNAARPTAGQKLSAGAMRNMNQAVVKAGKDARRRKALFVPESELKGRRRLRTLAPLFIGFILPFVLFLTSGVLHVAFGPLVSFPVVGAALGALFGSWAFWIKQPPAPLGPDGTALRDQLRGFRTYIKTAETKQLNLEADQDIYRRYLPWAVLFGLSERWTRTCQELAAAGLIPPLDTSFWVGNGSALDISHGLDSVGNRLTTAGTHSGGGSSGGGSGGSSGFSSSSSGGSGGGGTSASSW